MSDRGTLSLVSDDRRQVAMDGSTSPYKKREVTPEELEKAETDLRNEAKVLAKQIDSTYWDLGRCLYDVFDGLPGGYRDLMRGDGARAARKSLFEKWGFASFAEYCEKEVGILKRSAENLRHAYYVFEIMLILPTELRTQIRALGRSKVYQLAAGVSAKVISQDNIMSWTDKAKSMTFEELKKTIKAAKAADKGQTPDPEEIDQNGGSGDGGDGDSKVPPAPETQHTIHASLFDGQFETYSSAMEQAKRLSRSEKIGHNIELICQDFLANNDFDKDSSENKKAYLAKMEIRLGMKLIAIDPKDGAPVYGTDLLWLLVKEKAEAAIQSEGPGNEAEEEYEEDEELDEEGSGNF